MTLGERLVMLRNEKSLSQDTLAEALGVSRQSVSKWETDASIPELDKLIRLSDLFDISLDELVRGKPGSTGPTISSAQTMENIPWPQRVVQLYQDRMYLLGWLPVVWGIHDLLKALGTLSPLFGELSGGEDIFALMWALHIENLLKIIFGILFLVVGKKKAGTFRWYHLGWVPVIVGLFGLPTVRWFTNGLLSLLLPVPFILIRRQELLPQIPSLLAGTADCLLLCILGILVLVFGQTAEKANPQS